MEVCNEVLEALRDAELVIIYNCFQGVDHGSENSTHKNVSMGWVWTDEVITENEAFLSLIVSDLILVSLVHFSDQGIHQSEVLSKILNVFLVVLFQSFLGTFYGTLPKVLIQLVPQKFDIKLVFIKVFVQSLAVLGVHHLINLYRDFDNRASYANVEAVFDALNHLLVDVQMGIMCKVIDGKLR